MNKYRRGEEEEMDDTTDKFSGGGKGVQKVQF